MERREFLKGAALAATGVAAAGSPAGAGEKDGGKGLPPVKGKVMWSRTGHGIGGVIVTDGLKVYPKVIEKRLRSELPFMATENIMMDAVKAGGDRQELHERIRTLSMQAGRRVKEEGLDNNLLELIAADPAFGMSLEDLEKTMEPSRYIGCAPHQVERYLNEVIRPILDANRELLGVEAQINV